MMLLGFVSVLLQSLIQSANSADILVIGDSYAKQSLNYLAGNCAGKTVANFGVDMSLAVDWANGVCVKNLAASCSAATAAQGAPGAQFVWFSAGGNDFMMGACVKTAEQLSQDIYGALVAVKAALPTAKILMTGYCTPPASGVTMVPPTCQPPTEIGPLNDAVKLACEKTVGCTFVDATSACGGSRVAYSQAAFFQDPIHPNQIGYQKIFQLPGVQNALSCGPAAAPVGPSAAPVGPAATTAAGTTLPPVAFEAALAGILPPVTPAALPTLPPPAKYIPERGGMLRGAFGQGKALTFSVIGLAAMVFAAAGIAIIRRRRTVSEEYMGMKRLPESITADETIELLD
jgi:hypothetical protein